MTDPICLPTKSLTERVVDATWSVIWFVPMLLVLTAESMAGDAPKPVAAPGAVLVDWQTNPQAALQAVLADNQRLMQAVQDLIAAQRADWVGWAVGGVGVLIGFLKVFNGPAGALAEAGWALIAPKVVKDAEKKRDVMADGFKQVAAIMRSFPADTPLGAVIDKLDRRLPEEVKRVYREWEANEADDRPSARSVVPVVGGPVVATYSSGPTNG